MRLLTIIITVFNQAKYIEECINSMVDSFDDNNIIIIDDGSTDNSVNVIKQLNIIYPFINCIFQKNKGVSQARNIALSFVTTPYVTFVDGDDCIEKGTYKNILEIIDNDFDIIQFPICFNWESHKEKIKSLNKEIYGKENFLRSLIVKELTYSCCNKIFKSKLLNEISFDVGVRYEDAFYLLSLSTYINKVLIIDQGLYLYRYNLDSFSLKRPDENKIVDFIKMSKQVLKIIKEYQLEQFYSIYFCIYTLIELARFMNYFKIEKNIVSQFKVERLFSFNLYGKFPLNYKLFLIINCVFGIKLTLNILKYIHRLKK
ncbi:putative glycosyltransferase EpsJ [termite gut metagenome]|uniref:Putative glycosyltransferase EpsJ n=1 Tax=termite gut metagenome TaxID=433724 RepID=A0A5J4SWP9_9ZZZZ